MPDDVIFLPVYKVLSSERIDIVFDGYNKKTRKRQTRTKRGKKGSFRIVLTKDTPVHKNAEQVMSVDENKTDLFFMITDTVNGDFKAMIVL